MELMVSLYVHYSCCLCVINDGHTLGVTGPLLKYQLGVVACEVWPKRTFQSPLMKDSGGIVNLVKNSTYSPACLWLSWLSEIPQKVLGQAIIIQIRSLCLSGEDNNYLKRGLAGPSQDIIVTSFHCESSPCVYAREKVKVKTEKQLIMSLFIV